MFCVLIEFHLMVGLDAHKDIIPGAPPVPVPFAPHMTSAMLNWMMTPSMSSDVRATWTYGRVMQRGTDIQSYIPHIPLSPAVSLAPLLTMTSGSKSHFGPATVKVNGSPIAAALGGVVNPNLNCGDIPTPTGIVVAPNTVLTSMSVGDIIGGILAMATDAFLQAVANELTGGLGDVEGAIAQLFMGTPVGYSFNSAGEGLIGMYGRQSGAVGDMARGLGQWATGAIGGNESDRSHGADGLVDGAKKFGHNVATEHRVWDWKEPNATGGALNGIAGALDAHDRKVTQDRTPGTAFDNPDAEEF